VRLQDLLRPVLLEFVCFRMTLTLASTASPSQEYARDSHVRQRASLRRHY
jgi:hypothetical protein